MFSSHQGMVKVLILMVLEMVMVEPDFATENYLDQNYWFWLNIEPFLQIICSPRYTIANVLVDIV